MAKLRYRTRYVKDYWGVFDYHTNKRKPMCRCIDLNHAARIVRALNEYADRNEPWTNPIYAVKKPEPVVREPHIWGAMSPIRKTHAGPAGVWQMELACGHTMSYKSDAPPPPGSMAVCASCAKSGADTRPQQVLKGDKPQSILMKAYHPDDMPTVWTLKLSCGHEFYGGLEMQPRLGETMDCPTCDYASGKRPSDVPPVPGEQ